MKINIHSHDLSDMSRFKILNLSIGNTTNINELIDLIEENNFISFGIHPWDTSFLNGITIPDLYDLFKHKNVIAIGEIGLDRLRGATIETQLNIFESQLKIASELSKPVIVHVVKCINEVLQLKAKYKEIPAWIIHGFRGNVNQANLYISKGFYLSFGEKYNIDAIKKCPLNKIFIETDVSTKKIEDIYSKISEDIGIKTGDIEKIIKENFAFVFKK